MSLRIVGDVDAVAEIFKFILSLRVRVLRVSLLGLSDIVAPKRWGCFQPAFNPAPGESERKKREENEGQPTLHTLDIVRWSAPVESQTPPPASLFLTDFSLKFSRLGANSPPHDETRFFTFNLHDLELRIGRL